MSTTTITVAQRRSAILARMADYLELTKPRIVMLEMAVVVTAALLAGPQPWLVLHAVLGTALVAASASACNQLLERRTDARMPRTADRPLPSGRLAGWQVAWFGVVTGLWGVIHLLVAVNAYTAVLALATWGLYVLVYTPLKARTASNTLVGAVAGAMPALMGWTAMGRAIDLEAATLALVLFLWQFPHFMAIAWIYRDQYSAAGLRMLPVVDPGGLRAGAQAVVAALLLLPVSLVPAVLPEARGWLPIEAYLYVLAAAALGLGQLVCALLFLMHLNETAARRLLRASLIYLPGLLVLLVSLMVGRA